ncbi:bifunctional DNA-binding transcriptional regulator/O6-methylguanine-DNA [Sesbania bispinosa]|nr:bifunctional DNA-binding transcriptional regulator/O6-methylguanine-DNA [Sesbania bispinosa]
MRPQLAGRDVAERDDGDGPPTTIDGGDEQRRRLAAEGGAPPQHRAGREIARKVATENDALFAAVHGGVADGGATAAFRW